MVAVSPLQRHPHALCLRRFGSYPDTKYALLPYGGDVIPVFGKYLPAHKAPGVGGSRALYDIEQPSLRRVVPVHPQCMVETCRADLMIRKQAEMRQCCRGHDEPVRRIGNQGSASHRIIERQKLWLCPKPDLQACL